MQRGQTAGGCHSKHMALTLGCMRSAVAMQVASRSRFLGFYMGTSYGSLLLRVGSCRHWHADLKALVLLCFTALDPLEKRYKRCPDFMP